MNNVNQNMGLETEMAAPLHLQRLQRSLNLQPFFNQVHRLFQWQISDSDNESSDSEESETYLNNVLSQKEENRINKLRLYNMENVGEERKWLQELLLSDTCSSSSDEENDHNENPITEEEFQDMLKRHILRKKYQAKFYQKPEYIQYQYYGSGFLSSYDRFLEHQKVVAGTRKKKEKKPEKKCLKMKKEKPESNKNSQDNELEEKWSKTMVKSENFDESEMESMMKNQFRGRGKKKHSAKNPEMMALKRRKIWMMMSKKELGKVQRAKTNNHKEVLISCKKVATHCMKYWRQRAMQSQKNMKESVWRAKRLTREMQSYWKRYDRVERETRKRLEKEAEEQRKMDVELIEAKRQQRKLNFLITQTELYAHFMSRKMGKGSQEEQLRILNQLDEEKNPRLSGIDDYDSELVKQKAKRNAMDAFDNERARTRQFDPSCSSTELRLSDTPETLEHPQPSIFKGSLKGYQLKGMNWLANLYDQGISGILADEMGLGKTVQSIAFLCHVAEKYSVWGPFLIISPASTLHNWQQEMARFVPCFKVVPYWGNPQERKILRQFWDTKDLHTKDASFHVVITSYQLIITDYKYFNRIKWQYMILDEAQAIKSTSSMRWKLLLGFSCRNRLLLSGTPIQNSMAELWALLHFIMPTLFDSHEEFNEWFSKDIESHAENKTGIDEKHLSRLHMILKPFMLRRIKKDVENELSDKIEVMVYCPLTTRQKLLYSALRKKIRVEDLIHYTVGGSDSVPTDKNFTSNLMNLVMQFRKVCNHPELFERRDARSPFFMNPESYEMPVVLYNEGILDSSIPSRNHISYNKFFIFATEYIHRAIFSGETENAFSFTRFMDVSPMELNGIFVKGILERLCQAFLVEKMLERKRHSENFWIDEGYSSPTNKILVIPQKCVDNSDFNFTKNILQGKPVYTHTTHAIHSMQETVAHRILRSREKSHNQLIKRPLCSVKNEQNEDSKVSLVPQFLHVPRPTIFRECQLTTIPSFVCETYPKVATSQRKLYVLSSAANWAWKRHEMCGGNFGKKLLWFGCERVISPMTKYNFASPLSEQKITNFVPQEVGGFLATRPLHGWSQITIPDKQTLVTDAGKLSVLDSLLKQLKQQGHRVLIYSQMTKMIDLLEEYMYFRKHTFIRLDGSSKISDRRDMVADFQKRADIFVFLLSTRAGGLGINLTAADTVIFYDSDWNPTVDQQAMDRAHRLGQTKQVTVYRLICKGTIEERIMQRAREKSEIQRMVISGGNFKPDTLKPKEVVSLLLDDEEIEAKYSQKSEEKRLQAEEMRFEAMPHAKEKDRKRKQTSIHKGEAKRMHLDKTEDSKSEIFNKIDVLKTPKCNSQRSFNERNSQQLSDYMEEINVVGSPVKSEDETSSEGLVVDVDRISPNEYQFTREYPKVSKLGPHFTFGSVGASGARVRPSPRGTNKRGRPRGSRRGGLVSGKGRSLAAPPVVGACASSSPSPSSSALATTNVPGLGLQVSSQDGQPACSSGILETDATSLTSSLGPVKSSFSGSIRRGPGRPRLKPGGPPNQGHRGGPPFSSASHHKKVQRPLQVPIRSHPINVQPRGGPISSSATNPQAQMPQQQQRPFGFYTQQTSPRGNL